jgi:hypothetical protein
MPEKEFAILLNDICRIFVYLSTNLGNLENFVVKLEYFHANKWIEVQRYDCFHGMVHKDILNRQGKKIRTKPFLLMDKTSGIDMAIQDFKENYEMYIWRFINDKK